MPTTIQLRRDTAANWTSVNPVLAQGEIGIVLDTYKFKIGTGSTVWNSLDYADVLGPGAFVIDYRFSDITTDSDPGNGYLRLDNTTQLSATIIRADLLDAYGADVTAMLDALDDADNPVKGHIRICKTRDPTKWILFEVTSIATPSGYRNIAVTELAGSGADPFTYLDRVTLVFSRTGDKGDPGIDGDDGTDGADGKTLLSGSGPPSGGLGVDGDFYIDTSADTIYGPKTSGAWGSPTSIVGSGADGATWYFGSGAPSGGLGNDGDFYLRTSNYDVYGKASGSWSVIGNLKGADGTDGTNGSTWYFGSGVPSGGTGVNGDFYLRTSNYDLYEKASGSWSVIGNLKGATGAAGDGVVSYFWQSAVPASTGSSKRFYADRDGTILSCWGNVVNGDGSSTANFDVKLNGATIYTSSTKPSVSAGQHIGTERVPDVISFNKFDYFEVVVVDSGGTLGGLRLYINFSYEGV